MTREKQELYCHNCQCYVQFDIDLEQSGNHVIICPNCGHQHYRVVVNGIITEARWNHVGGYVILGTSSSTLSTYATYVAGGTGSGTDSCSPYTYATWNNFGTGNGFI